MISPSSFSSTLVLGVDRLEGKLPPLPPAPVEILEIVSLDVCGVPEEDRRKLGCGVCGEDVPFEAPLHQGRQASGVIDVRVAQHGGRHGRRRERHRTVPALTLGAAPLKEPAVEEDPRTGRRQQMLRARDVPRCTVDRDPHGPSVPR